MGKTANCCFHHKSFDRTASSRAPSYCEWHPWLYGCPWRDIPAERYGNHRTISSSGSIGGEKAGFGQRWSSLDAASRCSRKDRLGSPLCRWYGCTRPSAQLAAKGGTRVRGFRSQVLAIKVHVKAEGYGKPMYFVLTGENGMRLCFPESRVESQTTAKAPSIAAGI